MGLSKFNRLAGISSRVSRRLLLIVLSIGLAGVLVLFGLSSVYNISKRNIEISENLIATATIFLSPLEQSIWALDMVQVELQVESLAALPYIDHVHLKLEDGTSLLKGEEDVSSGYLLHATDIIHNDGAREYFLASLSVGTNADAIMSEIIWYEFLELSGAFVLIILLSFASFWVHQVYLTNRVLSLARQTGQLTAEDLKRGPEKGDLLPEGAGNRDEVDELSASIEKLWETGHHALTEAAESEAKFRLLAESVKEVFWLADPEQMKLLYVSPACSTVVGETPEAILNDFSTFLRKVHPDDREIYTSKLPTKPDQVKFLEYRIIHKNGSIKWVQERALPVTDENGKIWRIVGILEDITARKSRELEQANQQVELERQVKERTEDLEVARDAAEAANRSKTLFLANMSHEIRTPMNGVIGTAELLENSALSSEQQTMVRTIQNSSRALLRIIDDILDVTKIEAGKLTINKTPSNLLRVFERAVETVTPIADEKHVQVVIFVDPRLPRQVELDPTRTNQILINLLSNAIKFSKKPDQELGRVVLTAVPIEDSSVRITVADNGVGISDNLKERLFQPFERDKAAVSDSISGTGLGLMITKNLVTLLGGTITYESEEGTGSTFEINLPLKASGRDDIRVDLEGREILCLVDDDYRRDLSQSYLEFLGGTVSYCEAAKDLVDAMVAAAGNEPIALLALEDLPACEATWESVRAATPQGSCVMQTRNRAAKLGQVAKDVYVIQRFPVLMSQLEQALSTLIGGSTGPEVDHQSLLTDVAEKSASSKSRVLLVEDNEINRYVISEQLRLLGYSFETGSNGEEGLSLWRQSEFDVILADCQMPVMDGFEMTTSIREQEKTTGKTRIPIIAITANALTGERERCLEHGMDEYLTKPLELSELRRCLSAFHAG